MTEEELRQQLNKSVITDDKGINLKKEDKVFTSKQIEQIISNYNQGKKITRTNNIFYNNIEGTRKAGILLAWTKEEIGEYTKCALDIYYFIETYLNIKIRDYQREWIDAFINNRFQIYCTSRQTGYNTIMAACYLWYMSFNIDKTITLIGNKGEVVNEFLELIFKYYKQLPFFLKLGIGIKNRQHIAFDNGCRIKVTARCKEPTLGYTTDILSFLDFAHIPVDIINNIYNSVIPTIVCSKGTKIHIQSCPNGNNLFYKLVNGAERKIGDPKKNMYSIIKTYYWEVPGRDEAWKNDILKYLPIEAFDQEYDLQFFIYNRQK